MEDEAEELVDEQNEEEDEEELLQGKEEGTKRLDFQYYRVLIEVWKQIDRSTWIGFNIFLIFEGALLVVLGEMLFAGDIDLAIRLLVVATIAALSLIITGYMQLLLFRRRESQKLVNHQARVLERSMAKAFQGTDEERYFPMFFLTHRAVFAGTLSKEDAARLADKRRKMIAANAGESLETRIRDFNYLDPDDQTLLRDDPEEIKLRKQLGRLHPLATKSESSIMIGAVPRALFLFWMVALSVSLGAAVALLGDPSFSLVNPHMTAIVVGVATFLVAFAALRKNLIGRID